MSGENALPLGRRGTYWRAGVACLALGWREARENLNALKDLYWGSRCKLACLNLHASILGWFQAEAAADSLRPLPLPRRACRHVRAAAARDAARCVGRR